MVCRGCQAQIASKHGASCSRHPAIALSICWCSHLSKRRHRFYVFKPSPQAFPSPPCANADLRYGARTTSPDPRRANEEAHNPGHQRDNIGNNLRFPTGGSKFSPVKRCSSARIPGPRSYGELKFGLRNRATVWFRPHAEARVVSAFAFVA